MTAGLRCIDDDECAVCERSGFSAGPCPMLLQLSRLCTATKGAVKGQVSESVDGAWTKDCAGDDTRDQSWAWSDEMDRSMEQKGQSWNAP